MLWIKRWRILVDGNLAFLGYGEKLCLVGVVNQQTYSTSRREANTNDVRGVCSNVGEGLYGSEDVYEGCEVWRNRRQFGSLELRTNGGWPDVCILKWPNHLSPRGIGRDLGCGCVDTGACIRAGWRSDIHRGGRLGFLTDGFSENGGRRGYLGELTNDKFCTVQFASKLIVGFFHVGRFGYDLNHLVIQMTWHAK